MKKERKKDLGYFRSKCNFSTTISPKSEFAQANHCLVKYSGLSGLKDSCIIPVPPSVFCDLKRVRDRISSSSGLGNKPHTLKQV